MRSKAKIESEIAALEERKHEVASSQGLRRASINELLDIMDFLDNKIFTLKLELEKL